MSKKLFHCLGFGEFENKCARKARANPFWCDRCNKLQLESKGRQAEQLEQSFIRTTLAAKAGAK